jgi:uncharacterized membrane protein YphA (DoxX/SURF4 family)
MNNMDDSIAQARVSAGPLELPAWKTVLSVAAAFLLAVLFIIAGIWKIMDPYDAATRMVQAKVPGALALPAAVGFGIAETFAAVLLVVPRFRRWGAWLAGILLVAFMIYIGYYYEVLRGEECSCFPWIKRAVGPGFFVGDAVMLVMAALAGIWARRSESKRGAAIVLGAVAVFAFASLGTAYSRQAGAEAPASISVNGQPYSLESGKHFIYFFDPECGHCYQAAKAMAGYDWSDVRIIGVATAQPQFARGFLQDTGLPAELTSDVDLLKNAFDFKATPYAVAIENGRQKGSFIHFEGNEPAESLKKIGFIE